jgi:hypothetical protein
MDSTLPSQIKFIRQYKLGKAVYDIEMYSQSDTHTIEDDFGLYLQKKSGKRLQADLEGVTILNGTTFPTLVHVHVLKELSQRHQAANPGQSCFVNYLPCPELKICPTRGPAVTLSYTQAVTKMPHHFNHNFLPETIKFLHRRICLLRNYSVDS